MKLEYKSLRIDGVVETLTKAQVRHILEGHYRKSFVKDIIDNEKGFRLSTPTREIWTVNESGVPHLVSYGVCD